MITNFSRTIFLLLFAVSALTACQQSEGPLQATEAAYPQYDEDDCPNGEEREFFLRPIVRTILGEQPDYSFDLHTAEFPFTSVSCVCRVKEYNFIFASSPTLPKKEDILVTNSEGVELPFDIVDDNQPLQTIQITEFDLLQDAQLEAHISWKFSNYSLALADGTGLCVIDNIATDPGDTTLARVKPWILEDQPSEEDPLILIRKILIPEAMTY